MRWKATIAYDGTDFNGWQSQPSGNTIQDFLEKRLAFIFDQPIRIHGSGRTDTSVHARGQVCHWDADWPHPAADLLRALQTGLPRSILVTAVQRASDTFHARYSAWGKRYIYHLCEGRALPTEIRYTWSLGHRGLNITAMQLAAAPLIGIHDFSAFSATRAGKKHDKPMKTLRRLDIVKRGRHIKIIIEADGFLYKMARGLVGGLVAVGIGQESSEGLKAILASRQRDERFAIAPAQGLFLDRVFYRPNPQKR